MLHPNWRLSTVVGIGLLAPLWWTWSISKLVYAFYIAAGSPATPSATFISASLLLPSLALGLAIGALIANLSSNEPGRLWWLFWASTLVSATLLDLTFNQSASAVIELFRSPSNCAFLIASSAQPLYKHGRAYAAGITNAKLTK